MCTNIVFYTADNRMRVQLKYKNRCFVDEIVTGHCRVVPEEQADYATLNDEVNNICCFLIQANIAMCFYMYYARLHKCTLTPKFTI